MIAYVRATLKSLGAGEQSPRSMVLSAGFIVLVVGHSAYFSHHFVAGLYSQHIEQFSVVIIPLLTLLAFVAALRFLPFWMYCGLALMDLLLSVGIATYHDYFRENVDMHAVLSGMSEGTAVAGAVISLVPIPYFIGSTAVLVLQCTLARRIPRGMRTLVLAGLICLVTPLSMLAAIKIPPTVAGDWLHYDKVIKVHGFYTAFAFDLLTTGARPSQAELLAELEAIEEAHPVQPLGIRLDVPKEYDRLLVLQVESLDYAVLDYRVNGVEVTPFFNALRSHARFLKMQALPKGASGSSAADFAFLTGHAPLPRHQVYRLIGFDYSRALPHHFATAGIPMTAYHGNDRSFFGRATGYTRMGFAKFVDAADYPRIDTTWGVSDELFLSHSRDLIEATQGPHCFFLITLSSHVPFDYVQNPVFPGRDDVARYFNSINYVDRAVEAFFTALSGRYLVVIYADHASGVRNAAYESQPENVDLIPAYITLLADGVFRPAPTFGTVPPDLNPLPDHRSLHDVVKDGFPHTVRADPPAPTAPGA